MLSVRKPVEEASVGSGVGTGVSVRTCTVVALGSDCRLDSDLAGISATLGAGVETDSVPPHTIVTAINISPITNIAVCLIGEVTSTVYPSRSRWSLLLTGPKY